MLEDEPAYVLSGTRNYLGGNVFGKTKPENLLDPTDYLMWGDLHIPVILYRCSLLFSSLQRN
jgi:hypothetical protein